MPSRVFIVEDHPLVRQITSEFVGGLPDVEVCGAASSAEEALNGLPDDVDLLVVDVSLPGMSGIDLVAEVAARWPTLLCLMLSGHTEVGYVERALAAGARGYVMKGDTATLAESVRCVSDGGTYVSEAVRERLPGGKATPPPLPPQR